MERGPLAIGPDIEDGRGCGDAGQPLHGRDIGPVLLECQQHPVGSLVVADGTSIVAGRWPAEAGERLRPPVLWIDEVALEV